MIRTISMAKIYCEQKVKHTSEIGVKYKYSKANYFENHKLNN